MPTPPILLYGPGGGRFLFYVGILNRSMNCCSEITSTASSLPEVVGDAAMLVNPENPFDIARCIKEVLLDPALRSSLIEGGRIHAAKYSWKHTAQQVLEIYREIVR